MSEHTVQIKFPEKALADAGELADQLEAEIKMIGDNVTVRRLREDANNQDFGSTLVLVLGSAAVVEIAKGIAAWIRRTGTIIELETNGKKILVKDVDSTNLPEIMTALTKS